MVVWCELKIPLVRITVQHHSAVMPNSYPRDRIFSPHLTTIKDSYKFPYLLTNSQPFAGLLIPHQTYSVFFQMVMVL